MDLVSKYNIQVPRYTSYPTVPYWENDLNQETWKQKVRASFIKEGSKGLSLYIHLPFCESLCTYCACNTRITVNHKVEKTYIAALLAEWSLYLQVFGDKPIIKEIHLGGGTPTFFSEDNLQWMLSEILKSAKISEEHDFSFEGHPANTTAAHLQTLYNLGFRRVSFGIQDFDTRVQDTINRYQTFEEVEHVMSEARRIGYKSVNVDLVYGLPYQTVDTIRDTIRRITELSPERIAFYSYAHVPWLKPGQRKYSEKDLPSDKEKRDLYLTGKTIFVEAGYLDIGMDHFALPKDDLYSAFENGLLHRNFMGYTSQHTKLLVGLGCSSISDTWDAFAQNIKVVEEYEACVEQGKFPIFKGHILNQEDLHIRQHILNVMCRHKTEFDTTLCEEVLLKPVRKNLEEALKDNLVRFEKNRLEVTPTGKLYLRNICLAFDKRYWQKVPNGNVFSTTA